MIGREQFVEHRTVNFFLRAGQRQIRESTAWDVYVFPRKVADHVVSRRHDVDAEHPKPVNDRGGAAAGRGHHGDTVTHSGFLAGDQRRQFEQRFQVIHAQHAVRAEKRVGDFVGACHRAGVRGGEILSEFGAAELVNDDGFVGRVSAPRRMRETVGIAQRFEKQQDRSGVRIVDQHVGKFADADVGFVADRDQLGEAGAATESARQQAADHAARLRHEREWARLDAVHFQHRVDRQRERRLDAQDADAVGTEHAHAACARNREHLLLFAPARLAGLGKTIAVDRRDRNLLGHALLERCRNGVGRHHDERVIDDVRDRLQVGVGLARRRFRRGRD